MRTVTFSDEKVGYELGKDFVCAWKNRKDGFHNCDKQTETWIFQNSGDVYPTRNIIAFILTPDLQVLHYVTGYFSPTLFIKQLDFGRQVRGELFDEAFAPKKDAEASFKKLHREAATETREWAKSLGRFGGVDWDEAQTELGTYSYGGKEHAHGKACLQLVRDVHTYVALIHDDLAGDAQDLTKYAQLSQSVQIGRISQKLAIEADEKTAVEGLKTLSDVRGSFLYGNGFAEE